MQHSGHTQQLKKKPCWLSFPWNLLCRGFSITPSIRSLLIIKDAESLRHRSRICWMWENGPKDNTIMVSETETNRTKSISRLNMSERNSTPINRKISHCSRYKVKQWLSTGNPYVYLWLIHVDIWQKPTQYCKTIILQLKINKNN